MSDAPTLVRTPVRQTSLKKIPEALASLWKACLPEDPNGDVARALTINFVGIGAAREAAELRAIVDRLQRRTPCRAFLLLVDGADQESSAEVSATTRCHGTTRDIVLEEITIRLAPNSFEQIPGLVRPLLVNDLPNHLYWGLGWPKPETTFDELAKLCDHTVVDTARFLAPERELPLLDQRRQKGQRLTDLTWLRLRPWRRSLAEAFERLPWQTGTPTTCHIRHGKRGVAAARLLGNWLTERLQAKLQYEPTGPEDELCPDHVLLRAGGFEVELQRALQQIVVHVTTPEHCYMPFKVQTSRGSDGDLLAAAIDIG